MTNKINTLSSLLRANSDINVISENNTKDATVAIPKESLIEDLDLDHEMSRNGYIMIALGVAGKSMSQARAIASAACDFSDQQQLAQRMKSFDAVSRAIAPVIGVSSSASARIAKDTLTINREHCREMAKNLVGTLDPLAQDIATSLFASIFEELDFYVNYDSVVAFFPSIAVENQLSDPFTAALHLRAVQKSPFAVLKFDSSLRNEVLKGENQKFVGLVNIVRFVNDACTNFMRDFKLMAEMHEKVAAGFQLIGDGIQGRTTFPHGWVDHPAFTTLRTNITFHNLTLGEDKNPNMKTWAHASQRAVRSLVEASRVLISGENDDAILRQAAVDQESSAGFTTMLNAAMDVINEYVNFVPVTSFAKTFNIEQIEALDDPNMVNALVITMDHQRADTLDVYTGYALPTGVSSSLKTAALTTHCGTINLPQVPVKPVLSSITEIFANLSKEEASIVIEGLGDENVQPIDMGGYLSLVPGAPVALISNMHQMELASSIDFSDPNPNDRESELPYLMYLSACAYAHSITFNPGDKLRFHRAAEAGYPFRQAIAQISRTAESSATEIDTYNPIDLLIMPRLPNIVASGAFTVKNPTIDLARLVDKEFYIRGEEIKQFEIEELPAKPNDRRAALGRGDIPMFSYKQRIGTGPNGERKTVSAPIDLLPILSNQRNLFVSSIVSHVSLEQEIEAVLIACQGFNMLPGNSKLHANRRLADLIKSLGAAYMKSGIRSRDINGLSANRTTLELKEFMMHSGLATFRLIAHKIGVVDEDVTTKVIDMIDKLSDESFLSVVDKAIAIAASKV